MISRPDRGAFTEGNVSSQAFGFIPARLASTRLPRKLLLRETGRTLIEHTWQSARKAKSLAEVVVATDSSEIAAAVQEFGGRASLTGDHPSGTDRIAEVVRRDFPQAEIVVNIQGDEPEMDPAHVNVVVQLLLDHPNAAMSTLAASITTREQREATSCVKVVRGFDGRALYFSRLPIPFVRDGNPDVLLEKGSPWLLHMGLYAYRRDFLLELTKRPPSPLEQLEKLEQLRALEAGAIIQVGVVERSAIGIDTPEDYARFVEQVRNREH